MMATGRDDEGVQLFEVVVVTGKKDTIFPNSVSQMDGICLPAEPNRSWKHHVVTCPAQQRRQERACQVIVYVDSEG
jgi:hypothetical protein